MYRFLRGFSLGDTVSKKSSKSIPWGVLLVGVIVMGTLGSGVPGGLINFSVSRGFQGFSSSLFSPIAFIPDVVSGILKVF